jgi:hypothetical protein
MYIHSTDGTNGSGLRFVNGYVQPCESNGSDSNGDTDLGQTNSRFKDLYLSGTAYTDTVLVGKTSTSITTRGLFVDSNGTLKPTSDGAVGMLMNRKTSDGDIIEFRKDNTTVGSIGVDAGDNLYIGSTATNHGGIYMNDSGVLPMSAGAVSDNTKDLGNPNRRWNDLFLGGGVYLGGTGSANKLEDYEVGDFQLSLQSTGTVPTVTAFQYNSGRYIKIGALVHAMFDLQATITSSGTGQPKIAGFPFTSWTRNYPTGGYYGGGYSVGHFRDSRMFVGAGSGSGYQLTGYIDNGTSNMYIEQNQNGTAAAYQTGSNLRLTGYITYYTAS